MHHARPFRLLAGLAVLALAAACDQSNEPLSPTIASTPQFAQVPTGPNVDQHALGQAIPAFGGLYLANGVPTAFLTNAAARPALERALANFLSARGVPASQLQVLPARFSYSELESLFDRVRPPLFNGPGTVFADLDEAHNRITVGVENAAAEARVRQALDPLGLPDGAVEIVRTGPIYAVQTLRDRFDPIPGGVQIHFGQYLCSIGVIAKSGSQLGFVTASHCTDHQGGTEGTLYYQPLSSVDGTVIGIEAIDPDYFNRRQGPCPYAGAKCRWSDAAFIASTGARAMQLGSIATTTSLGSITWSGGYYSIGSTVAGNGMVGQRRDKVGRTTGHTYGTISASCVDTGVSGSNIVLLCQDFVSSGATIVGPGDSGSNVFSGSSSVSWAGQLWGSNSAGTMFVYSPASNVEDELGTLDVTGSGGGNGGPTSTLTASFTYSCHFGDCTFDGSGSTGDPTDFAWDFGDGSNGASGVVVPHSYSAAGNYDVTLVVTAGTATAQTSRTVSCATRGHKLQCK